MSSPLVMFDRSDVVAYYPLNEATAGTTYDYSGNGNNGTDTGTTIYKTVDGNRHRSFNGSSDVIKTSLASYDYLLGSTFTFWAKRNNSNTQYIFGRTVEGGAIDPLYVYSPDGNVVIRDGSNAVTSFTSTALTNDIWTHVAITIDSSRNIIVYLNGEIDTSTTVSGTGTLVLDNIYIGARNSRGTTDAYYQGQLKEFLILNRAITQAEIKALYRTTYIV